MKKLVQNFMFAAAALSIASCGGNGKSDTPSTADSLNVEANVDTAGSSVVYNIPYPMETFLFLKLSGIPFDHSVLNPIENVSKYQTHFSKAVNLGVYSADLSFCFLYEKNNDINKYLKSVNELTGSLGIDGGFMQSAAERAKTNLSNIDSLKEIAKELRVNTELYLKENKMSSTNAAIAAGGWIESTYVLANLTSSSKKEELKTLVAEQKYVLENLVKLLESFKDDKDIALLLLDIKSVEEVYDQLNASEKSTPATPANKEMQSIGDNTSVELSDAQLKSILEKITALRMKLIS